MIVDLDGSCVDVTLTGATAFCVVEDFFNFGTVEALSSVLFLVIEISSFFDGLSNSCLD